MSEIAPDQVGLDLYLPPPFYTASRTPTPQIQARTSVAYGLDWPDSVPLYDCRWDERGLTPEGPYGKRYDNLPALWLELTRFGQPYGISASHIDTRLPEHALVVRGWLARNLERFLDLRAGKPHYGCEWLPHFISLHNYAVTITATAL